MDMPQAIRLRNLLLLLPASFILGCIALTTIPEIHLDNSLSNAITLDLLLTTPLVYLLIIRKRSIPKTTVIPVIVLGMIVATQIIPKPHQQLLQWFMDWLFPILEVGVVAYMIFTIRKAILVARKENNQFADFHDLAKRVASTIFPQRVAQLMATEISTIYYALFSWKKHRPSSNEFTHYQSTSSRLLLYVFIFLILVEAFVIHLLLQNWNATVAWVVTGISFYTCLQVLAIAKSLPKRPISLSKNMLKLRWGFMNQAEIPLNTISGIQLEKREVEKAADTAYLSPLHSAEGNNVVITLSKPATMDRMYGFTKPFTKLVLYIDDPQRFIDHPYFTK